MPVHWPSRGLAGAGEMGALNEQVLEGCDRPVVMGIVNVTPDSFSDGGLYLAAERAVGHGLGLVAEGADIIDVGGESTRPGAHRVPRAEELQRVLPVITELATAGAVVSIDTMRAEVAARALEAGAAMINDVSGGLADPRMARCAAEAGVPYVAMHWRGHSTGMQKLASYGDVVADVTAELAARLDALTGAGVAAGQIILDPGLGFAKTAGHNWRLLAGLDALRRLGCPVLIGASRKRFLGQLLAGADGEPRPARERGDATTAVSALAAAAGVWGIRTHEVRATLDAIAVARAWNAHGRKSGGTNHIGALVPATKTAPSRTTTGWVRAARTAGGPIGRPLHRSKREARSGHPAVQPPTKPAAPCP